MAPGLHSCVAHHPFVRAACLAPTKCPGSTRCRATSMVPAPNAPLLFSHAWARVYAGHAS